MNSPGGSHTQGLPVRTARLDACCIRFPQLAWGGRIPTPKKLRLDSERIALPTRWARAAQTGATALGSTFRNMIVRLLAPSACTAMIYSFSRIASAFPYTSRAMEVHPKSPMTRMILHTDGPTSVTRHRISTILGKDWNTSAQRMIQNSHFPLQ